MTSHVPSEIFVNVSEMDAYLFCPRKWYLRVVLGIERTTDLMKLGKLLHKHTQRTLKRKELFLRYPERRLQGYLDYYLTEGGYPYIPLEVKKSRHPGVIGDHFKVQLAAYGLLLAARYKVPIPYGYLLFKDSREKVKVPFTADLWKRVVVLAEKLLQERLSPGPIPPILENTSVCRKCAYHMVCFA